jgi:hypothetical protein
VPERECTEDDPHPLLQFTSPRDGDTITSSPLEIFGQAGATGDFDSWILEYGEAMTARLTRAGDDGSSLNEPGKALRMGPGDGSRDGYLACGCAHQ